MKSNSHCGVWTQNVVIFVLNKSNIFEIMIKILSLETKINHHQDHRNTVRSKLLPCTFLMWQSFPHFEHTRCKYWIIIVSVTIFTLFVYIMITTIDMIAYSLIMITTINMIVYSLTMIITINIIVTCPQRLL